MSNVIPLHPSAICLKKNTKTYLIAKTSLMQPSFATDGITAIYWQLSCHVTWVTWKWLQNPLQWYWLCTVYANAVLFWMSAHSSPPPSLGGDSPLQIKHSTPQRWPSRRRRVQSECCGVNTWELIYPRPQSECRPALSQKIFRRALWEEA